MIKKILIVLLSLIFISSSNSKEIKIIKKVNNVIITNFDVENEIKYLKSLNPSLKNFAINDLQKYATNSLINEIIKSKELNKFYDFDKISFPRETLENFYITLGLNNENEFLVYLKKNDLNIDNVKKKLLIEYLWNSLIYKKYNNSVLVDENEIRNDVKELIESQKDELSFSLSEIVFKLEKDETLEKKYNKIEQLIKKDGFFATASLISISETSKIAGKLGFINQSQLSVNILDIIKDLKIGQYSKPIKNSNVYLILYIEDIKKIEKKYNFEEEVKKRLIFIRNERLKKYSRLYFDKVKISQKIE